MKQITAFIQPHMLSKVARALHALPHFPGFTLLRAKGHGRGRAAGRAYHPTERDMDLHDKAMLFVLCPDSLASLTVETIRQSAHTGLPGDGVIAVCEVGEVVRIGTGARGDDAV